MKFTMRSREGETISFEVKKYEYQDELISRLIKTLPLKLDAMGVPKRDLEPDPATILLNELKLEFPSVEFFPRRENGTIAFEFYSDTNIESRVKDITDRVKKNSKIKQTIKVKQVGGWV